MLRTSRRSRAFALIGVALLATVLAQPAGATTPGRNGRIAFQAATDAGLQIFTVRPNGKDLQQVTNVDGDATQVDLPYKSLPGVVLVGIEARWARAWANILAGRPPWRSTSVGERVDGARAASVAPARRDETPRSAWMVLGVPRDATAADIKRAFRRRALETHPDRGGDAEAFQAVHRAYERALARAERLRRRRRR